MNIYVKVFWVMTTCSDVVGYNFALKMEATWSFETLQLTYCSNYDWSWQHGNVLHGSTNIHCCFIHWL